MEDYFVFKGDSNLGFDLPVQTDPIDWKADELLENSIQESVLIIFLIILWKKLILTFPILSSLFRKYINSRLSINHWINRMG